MSTWASLCRCLERLERRRAPITPALEAVLLNGTRVRHGLVGGR